MKLNKEYRHLSNPLEKELYNKFINHCTNDEYSYIAFPTTDGIRLVDHVNEREKQIMINTIQWLGSPVGHRFLKSCGYTNNM